MGCLGCLRVAGDVFIPNKLAQSFIVRVSSDVTYSSSACSYVKTPMSGGCLDGVCGCLTVSGSYLGVSGRCLGEYRCHINHKQLNRSRYTKLLSFLPVTSCSQIGAKWQFHTFDWSWGFF